MHKLYILATGPFLYMSLVLFLGGLLFQVVTLVAGTFRKERFILSFLSLKSVLYSMIHWATPFGSRVMRRNLFLTLTGFAFHIGMLVIPFFLSAHMLLINEAWRLSWPVLTPVLTDGFTLFMIAACLYFLKRRLFNPEIRYISTRTDFLMPVLVLIPFVTGFWAAHGLPGFRAGHILHILSAEILFAAIPFTRMTHMIFGFFTRVYTSSEFGNTRFARDW